MEIQTTVTIEDSELDVLAEISPGQEMRYPSKNNEMGQHPEDPEMRIQQIKYNGIDVLPLLVDESDRQNHVAKQKGVERSFNTIMDVIEESVWDEAEKEAESYSHD